MDINWSAIDGILVVVLVIVVLWAALKLMSRLVIAVIVVIVLGLAFFGMHWEDFVDRTPPAAAVSDE